MSNLIFKHRLINRFSSLFIARLGLILITFGVIFNIINLTRAIINPLFKDQLHWEQFFASLIGMLLWSIGANIGLNLYSQLEIDNHGIKVEIITLLSQHWLFISWDEIIDIKLSPVSSLSVHIFKEPIYGLIVEKRVSIWHSINQLFYYFFDKYAIVLLFSLEKREELISIIRNQVLCRTNDVKDPS